MQPAPVGARLRTRVREAAARGVDRPARRDAAHGTVKNVGKMLLSIEILPKQHADQHPQASEGTSEREPEVAHSRGRLDWTRMWNPIYFIPAMCRPPGRVCLIFTFLALIFVIIYLVSPQLYSVYALASMWSSQAACWRCACLRSTALGLLLHPRAAEELLQGPLQAPVRRL